MKNIIKKYAKEIKKMVNKEDYEYILESGYTEVLDSEFINKMNEEIQKIPNFANEIYKKYNVDIEEMGKWDIHSVIDEWVSEELEKLIA